MDGYIKANSENVRGVTNWYSASGGSGGSIHITTVNYTGQGGLNISVYCICIIIKTGINICHFLIPAYFTSNSCKKYFKSLDLKIVNDSYILSIYVL